MLFNKSLKKITIEDVNSLIETKKTEDQEVEFKKTLPCEKGEDSWITSQKKVGSYAKKKILEELIAFANSYGGLLIIGIEESKTSPPYAIKLNPIPSVKALAERFKLICRDLIEPGFPMIEIHSLEIDNSGKGLVFFQIPKSRLAPHRCKTSRNCTVRREDRSEKMTMREIQDLTLNLSRGMDLIEKRFNKSRQVLDKIIKFRKPGSFYSIRISAQPISTELDISNVFTKEECHPVFESVSLVPESGEAKQMPFPIKSLQIKPTLRGVTCLDSDKYLFLQFTTYESGQVEYFLINDKPYEEKILFFPGWLITLCGNCLKTIENVRNYVGGLNIEYGMEIEIITKGNIPIQGYWNDPYVFASLSDETIEFPHYSVRDKNEFGEICSQLDQDLWYSRGLIGHKKTNFKI